MTENDIGEIERAISITVPAEYKTLMLERSDQLREIKCFDDEEFLLFDETLFFEPSEVIDVNLVYRESDGEGTDGDFDDDGCDGDPGGVFAGDGEIEPFAGEQHLGQEIHIPVQLGLGSGGCLDSTGLVVQDRKRSGEPQIQQAFIQLGAVVVGPTQRIEQIGDRSIGIDGDALDLLDQ